MQPDSFHLTEAHIPQDGHQRTIWLVAMAIVEMLKWGA